MHTTAVLWFLVFLAAVAPSLQLPAGGDTDALKFQRKDRNNEQTGLVKRMEAGAADAVDYFLSLFQTARIPATQRIVTSKQEGRVVTTKQGGEHSGKHSGKHGGNHGGNHGGKHGSMGRRLEAGPAHHEAKKHTYLSRDPFFTNKLSRAHHRRINKALAGIVGSGDSEYASGDSEYGSGSGYGSGDSEYGSGWGSGGPMDDDDSYGSGYGSGYRQW